MVLTSEERLHRKRTNDKKRNRTNVCLQDCFDEWRHYKSEGNFKNDRDFCRCLLDMYKARNEPIQVTSMPLGPTPREIHEVNTPGLKSQKRLKLEAISATPTHVAADKQIKGIDTCCSAIDLLHPNLITLEQHCVSLIKTEKMSFMDDNHSAEKECEIEQGQCSANLHGDITVHILEQQDSLIKKTENKFTNGGIDLVHNSDECVNESGQSISENIISPEDKDFYTTPQEARPYIISEIDQLSSIACRNSSSLQKHKLTRTGEKPYQCLECSKFFTTAWTLKQHARIHSGEKPYSCSLCDKCFSQPGQLNTHILTHTDEKPYQCLECSKAYTTAWSLKQHARTHSGEKPYMCSKCGKCFLNSTHLKNHLRTHTGEKPYNCPECLKSFAQTSALKRHARTHSGEKLYMCNKCGKCFPDSSQFKRHMWTHTGEKLYKCPECSKSFNRTDNLNVHLKTHSRAMPYRCPECKKRFSHSSQLEEHLLTHTVQNHTSTQNVVDLLQA